MKNGFLSIFLRWLLTALLIAVSIIIFLLRLRKIVFVAAKSEAENIILDSVNKAIINVLGDNNIKYDDIAVVSKDQDGNITCIEIDTQKINMLKSLIADETYRIINQNGEYTLKIPIGTLLNHEYTSGYGPSLRFKMKLAHSERLDFESRFSDAGINNVLHQILINININCSVLAAGSSRSFSLKSEAIAAQTVIAGRIPDSFTNVDEANGEDIADDIFNFRN